VSRHRSPDFDALVGGEVSGDERERLRRTHELLVQSPPPPELSPELEKVPWPEEALRPLGLIRTPRQRQGRSWFQVALAAAAVLVVGFFIGQAFGSRSSSFTTTRVIRMHGTGAAPHAFAAVDLGQPGGDRNWPMEVTVTDLPQAQNGGHYDLWLSLHGKPIALCGTFNTHITGDTSVRMSAAYDLTELKFDGWIVTRHTPGVSSRHAPTVLTTEPSASA
jgi:hypothetical protein